MGNRLQGKVAIITGGARGVGDDPPHRVVGEALRLHGER